MTDEPEPKRCPLCGRGDLVDITFREGPNPEGVDEELQVADSRQVETYSCGHEVVGPSLAESAAAADDLEVERRASEDTADPA
ncbi:MAG: hypothetical protein ABR518_01195 [Actinomycetota bacterium]